MLACAIGALICICATYIASRSVAAIPLPLSFAIVSAGFAVDRSFTNKIQVKTFDVEWSTNGIVPWGETKTVDQPITIYRRVGGGYCYDSFNSAELRRRLSTVQTPTVKAQYNLIWNFGKLTGYNVRSVANGLLLNDGYHVVRDASTEGGQMLGPGKSLDCLP